MKNYTNLFADLANVKEAIKNEDKTLILLSFFQKRSMRLSFLLAQRPITLVLMMINSCSYSTNDLVFN